jgi:hypothetical protein
MGRLTAAPTEEMHSNVGAAAGCDLDLVLC